MNVEELIDHYAHLLAEGEIEYSNLNQILADHQIPIEERAKVKALIDDKSQKSLMINGTEKDRNDLRIKGIIILSVGLALTIMSLFDMGLFKDPNIVFLFPGLAAFGGLTIFRSKLKKEGDNTPQKEIKMKRYFEK